MSVLCVCVCVSVCLSVCPRNNWKLLIRNWCNLVRICVTVNPESYWILPTSEWSLTLTAKINGSAQGLYSLRTHDLIIHVMYIHYCQKSMKLWQRDISWKRKMTTAVGDTVICCGHYLPFCSLSGLEVISFTLQATRRCAGSRQICV